MSIRLKLILSYAAMLVIPLFMMIFTAILLTLVFRGDLQNIKDQYGTPDSSYEVHNIDRMLKEVRRTAQNSPLLFKDSAYLNEVQMELKSNSADILVRTKEELTYIPSTFQYRDFLRQLPGFKWTGYSVKREPIQLGAKAAELSQYDFSFPDGQQGSVFVITKVNPIVNFAQKFFPTLFISLILVLILTHTLLTYFVSRSIIRPLRELKDATKRIKDGDLDFNLKIANKDEIGELSQAFEQMRVKLRESIQTQLQYEENRKELISNISHDLRTPLTAIRGYIDGIGDGIADTPDKVQKYLDIISLKAGEMDQMIDELFLYSKLDLNHLPFHYEKINLLSFLTDWSEELEFELNKNGVNYDAYIRIDPGTEISIDRDKLRRVFSNIISNSLKYMTKDEKRITLNANVAGGEFVMKLHDNGQGIDAEALPFIFERFYRADPSRNSHTGGSGLGLAISKQIIEGHGGSIKAESIKGEGTGITITLPLIPSETGEQA
ncbi:HAMP domain-containing sensor histidine kinase [Paenibacillus sp. J22TS3]|uniref:sensor histidine kinase n=1 Tax=Paenibacillus sp. J22TS3 TaxID=2807192 RepID=UPI001B09F6BA|nr:HAMP domain-containing sensor histidine kinase [Paenibacillus sp. J22TS3]GIP23806.1 two-component sensor histidine kinase [Paenibacillus sp. J22TS3]